MDQSRDIHARISLFVSKVQGCFNDEFAELYSSLTPPSIEVEYMQKYARVFTRENSEGRNGSRSVVCFIALKDINTKAITAKAGDILKAAGWKAPTKHPRGSVFSPTNGMEAMNSRGTYIRYLK
jgi:hypothetical protein